ncbi:MAG TPA: TfoX/Sxy family protein, partial [Thermomicrobiales bacterium]|nr:TfoX/Sxy family protein [Thermomicrobiales bacterium]
MATEKATVEFILDQLAPLPVRARAMFGEYGLYCDEKFVALICDDTLFVKPTAISQQFFTDADLAPPYPRAKDHYIVSGDHLDDSAWLQEVIARTSEVLPLPKPKPRKKSAP